MVNSEGDEEGEEEGDEVDIVMEDEGDFDTREERFSGTKKGKETWYIN